LSTARGTLRFNTIRGIDRCTGGADAQRMRRLAVICALTVAASAAGASASTGRAVVRHLAACDDAHYSAARRACAVDQGSNYRNGSSLSSRRYRCSVDVWVSRLGNAELRILVLPPSGPERVVARAAPRRLARGWHHLAIATPAYAKPPLGHFVCDAGADVYATESVPDQGSRYWLSGASAPTGPGARDGDPGSVENTAACDTARWSSARHACTIDMGAPEPNVAQIRARRYYCSSDLAFTQPSRVSLSIVLERPWAVPHRVTIVDADLGVLQPGMHHEWVQTPGYAAVPHGQFRCTFTFVPVDWRWIERADSRYWIADL
jgi:hypothetical protein